MIEAVTLTKIRDFHTVARQVAPLQAVVYLIHSQLNSFSLKGGSVDG